MIYYLLYERLNALFTYIRTVIYKHRVLYFSLPTDTCLSSINTMLLLLLPPPATSSLFLCNPAPAPASNPSRAAFRHSLRLSSERRFHYKNRRDSSLTVVNVIGNSSRSDENEGGSSSSSSSSSSSLLLVLKLASALE